MKQPVSKGYATSKSVQNPNDNSRSIDKSITKKEETNQDELNHYYRANGYDEAGMNYIPTYATTGMPTRSRTGTIDIGFKTVELPTIDNPMNADSLRVYLSDII
ncbi:MAG: hypothetical protein U9O83_00875, partial [Campylobacterota bacterium]|nr:hypothetical protein [Campylobacterota bacterium]